MLRDEDGLCEDSCPSMLALAVPAIDQHCNAVSFLGANDPTLELASLLVACFLSLSLSPSFSSSVFSDSSVCPLKLRCSVPGRYKKNTLDSTHVYNGFDRGIFSDAGSGTAMGNIQRLASNPRLASAFESGAFCLPPASAESSSVSERVAVRQLGSPAVSSAGCLVARSTIC